MRNYLHAATMFIVAAFCFYVPVQAATPRLVVVISYDQFRGDYTNNFASRIGTKGFTRFVKEGAVFDSCVYNHANLLTGPGHATLLTACYPHRTGIPSNDYCEIESHTCSYCAGDPVHTLSPNQLQVPTLGDILKEKSPASKVVGIGIKDRAAILMAGKKANPVLWLDYSTRKFTTSTYYSTPSYLDELNRFIDIEKSGGKTWSDPGVSKRIDDQSWEGTMTTKRRTFPYTIPPATEKTFISDYVRTPYCLTDLFSAVNYMIDREELGADATPDLLVVGVSPTDFVGHTFGPDSREVEEFYVACDSVLANFIDRLDAKIGRSNYVVVLASDHGVAPIPEYKNSLPGGTPAKPGAAVAGRIHYKHVKNVVDSALNAKYNDTITTWVWNIDEPSIYLNDSVLKAKGISATDAAQVVCMAVRSIDGVLSAFQPAALLSGKCPEGITPEICANIRASTYMPRMGHVLMYPMPYWVFGSTPATHGTPYIYDQHIPMMMLGGHIQQQRSSTNVEPVDIAVTLAKWLGVTMPNVDGKMLPMK